MKCPKCGYTVRDGLTFCPKCGVEFNSSKGEHAFNPNAKEITNSRQDEYGFYKTGPDNAPPQKDKFYKRTWFIVLALILFWPLGVFLMWRYSRWSKVVKIIISILCAIVLIFTIIPSDEGEEYDTDKATQVEEQTSEVQSESKNTDKKDNKDNNKYIIKKQEGFDKLQSFYLQISDKDTEKKIIKIAEANNLFYETNSDIGFTEIDISESKGKRGAGAEPWYMFKTDSIHLYLTPNDEDDKDDNNYVFSKDYYVRDTYMSVNYTFFDKELYTENRIPGYNGGADERETIDTWSSVEEALKYAIEYKY